MKTKIRALKKQKYVNPDSVNDILINANVDLKKEYPKGSVSRMQDDRFYIEAKKHEVKDTEPKKKTLLFFNTSEWKQWAKRQKLAKKNPDTIILIRMEMSNGLFREFLAVEEFGCFFYKNKQYVFDQKLKYYIIERNMWAYDFAESLSLPIRKKIKVTEDIEKALSRIEKAQLSPKDMKTPISELLSLVENAEIVDVEHSLNPTTLKRFTDSEVIKQVLQGSMLGKIFKLMFIFICIIGIIVLFDFIADLYASGIFEKIGNLFNKK